MAGITLPVTEETMMNVYVLHDPDSSEVHAVFRHVASAHRAMAAITPQYILYGAGSSRTYSKYNLHLVFRDQDLILDYGRW